MLAEMDGIRGDDVQRVSLVQHIDRQAILHIPTALDVLVPQMRARFAKDLAIKHLRPLDPWPAITVRRLVRINQEPWMAGTLDDAIRPGRREMTDEELEAGREPHLYALELATLATPDTRTVDL